MNNIILQSEKALEYYAIKRVNKMLETLKYGMRSEYIKFVQRALNEKLFLRLKADGVFGKLTEEAIRVFQKGAGLPVNGVFGYPEHNLLSSFINNKYLSESQIESFAKSKELPVSIVKAMRDVEARAEGFLYDGRTVILFERHKFFDQLVKHRTRPFAEAVFNSVPDICNEQRGGYVGYEREYERLDLAASFDRVCALRSASYGLFQIMGFNHAAAGYSSVEDMVSSFQQSEQNQLMGMLNFVHSDRALLTAVKQRNYQRIAMLYNGKSYADNDYVTKLANADSKYFR